MKKLLALTILLISFIPFIVKAESLDLSCNKDETKYVDGGEEITCKLKYNSDQVIKKIKTNYFTSENLEFDTHIEINKNWKLDSIDGDTIELTHVNDGLTNDTILELKFIVISAKANAITNISLENITFITTNNQTLEIPNFSQSYKIYSCSNGLTSLNISGITLSPTFNIDEIYYTGETSNESIMISANKQCPQSVLDGIGVKDLTYGPNNIEISITSPRGIKNIYTLEITRTDTRSKDNNLKSLSINGQNLNFKTDIVSYSYEVKNEITSVEITYEKNDEKSTIDITGNENLKVGSNTILVKITSESGDAKTYTIYVTRNANENLYLKTLNIKGFNINFQSNKFIYNIDSNKILKTLDITFEPTDSSHEIIIIGNESLKTGNNKIVIRIENETGEVLDYVINLKQEKKYTVFILIGVGLIIGIIATIIITKYRRLNLNKDEDAPITKPEIEIESLK